MKSVDVFWSFRSPYSYLATPGMLDIRDKYQVNVNLRVVLPIAIRSPEALFNAENAKRSRYIAMDWARRAEFLGMPNRWPRPDPIVQDLETLKVADDQPYIFRLSKLGVEAQRRGRGIEFAYEVSHLLFGGTRDWHEGDHLARAAERAGLELASMDRAIENGDHMQEIERNQEMLAEAGHWGVPTLVFEGEPFFGQDRIDTLCWRLERSGLRRS
ncbi:2-hydroxychromene-2-carboxylate isomerase [Proteobacteria bacterium 005FR1]|nr:2-hydroxychromene-2-carboxylate isomerase [Proteobacteria bacterium 005FR1]